MQEMTPERWQEVQSVFHRALELPPDRRADYLDQICANDPEFRSQVDALLLADEEPADVFDSSFEEMASALAPSLSEADRRVGPYRLTKRIGRGGMGVVYLAHDDRLGRDVALKFIPVHLSENENARRRLVAEARAASALDHLNICTIFDIGEADDGRTYIAMAYYPGQTLRERLEGGPLSIDEAVWITDQIVEALSAAHARGIIHRDIKPGNVFLAHSKSAPEKETVKLLDFGLAKMAGLELTQTGATMGTVAYMSPEQADGKPVDHRSDIWSVGVLLYDMLAGERPFRGEHAQSVIYAILNKDPQPLESIRPGIPEHLRRVVHKCLAHDPASRYQGAGRVECRTSGDGCAKRRTHAPAKSADP